jgi:hypothetical protein
VAYSKEESERLTIPIQPRFNRRERAKIDAVRGNMAPAAWVRKVVLDVLAGAK